MKGAEASQGIDSIQIILRGMIEVTLGQGLGSRRSTNRDSIRCFKCTECDHFA